MSTILLGILLILSGCAKQKIIEQSLPQSKAMAMAVKGWLATLPVGEYAIGISYENEYFPSSTESLSRDFAAISLSRNHASYVVDKEVILSLADIQEIDYTSVKFNVVVSADMDYLKRASKELKLIDSFHSAGMHFGLFSFKQGSVPQDQYLFNPDEPPQWISDSEISVTNGKLIAISKAQEAELPDAFVSAQEKALSLIAQYRLQHVLAVIRDMGDVHDRRMAIETVTKTQTTYLRRVYVIPYQTGNFRSYTVYLQLESTP